MQPIRYADLPAICAELGIDFVELVHDRPARLCATSHVNVLYANPRVSLNRRCLACLVQLGLFLGMLWEQALEFADVAARGGYHLDQRATLPARSMRSPDGRIGH